MILRPAVATAVLCNMRPMFIYVAGQEESGCVLGIYTIYTGT